jgi:hypothetical protein
MTMAQAATIDQLMEQASQALGRTDYLACERLCEQALALAIDADDFDRVSRIVLPLQEARRQRRQIASEAGVMVLGEPRQTPEQILQAHEAGCFMLIGPPYDADDVTALRRQAADRGRFIEALLVDQPTLVGLFLTAMDQRGDAILAALPGNADSREVVRLLYDQLDQIGDHEIAHQRLADAARRAAHTPRPAGPNRSGDSQR